MTRICLLPGYVHDDRDTLKSSMLLKLDNRKAVPVERENFVAFVSNHRASPALDGKDPTPAKSLGPETPINEVARVGLVSRNFF